MVTTDRKIPITVSIPSSLVAEMDENRGKIPRSPYMVDILRKNIKKK